MTTDRLGFVGLGTMGALIATRLFASHGQLLVHNRDPRRAEALAATGIEVAGGRAELARACDIVFTCVSDTAALETVMGGNDGLLAGLAPGSVVVDLSTISPEVTAEMESRCARHGVGFVDAPVSGGPEGARAGTLSIMVGSTLEDADRVWPFLQAIGSTIVRLGPPGSGQRCKLANQILVAGNLLALTEALAFADAAGLDHEAVLTVLGSGAGGSWAVQNRGAHIVARDWEATFTVDLQLKDLRLVEDEARRLGVRLEATPVVRRLYEDLSERGLGGLGNHALAEALEER